MERMPVVFIGHGSPMNAIEDNVFTQGWKALAKTLPTPKGILMVSAHWYTNSLCTTNVSEPKMIYDMYGFPEALYRVKYPVKGSPELAKRLQALLGSQLSIDNTWGLDHGAWSVLVHLFPKADIPVVQLSVHAALPPKALYEIGRTLRILREEGILIIGSGNIVHNLRRVDWEHATTGYPWADAFDHAIKEAILNFDHETCLDYAHLDGAPLAVPTPDHYDPLLYVLGATYPEEPIQIYNDTRTMGSLSMTSYVWGLPSKEKEKK